MMLNLPPYLKARTMAATHRRMIDTASKAGPRLALDGFSGRFPQAVPAVPAPNVVLMCPVGAGVAVAAGDDGVAFSGWDELAAMELVCVGLAFVTEGSRDESERKGVGLDLAADAAEAEAKTLGQNVALND